MNKYRVKQMLDEYDECVCLKCMGEFNANFNTNSVWSFCPLCGTCWDGEFSVRHKRYPQKNNYDWRKPGYKTDKNGLFCQSDVPRLIIESNSSTNYLDRLLGSLMGDSWRLHSHTTIGSFIDGQSSFAHMFNAYNKNKRSYPNLRLRLLVGTNSKIIKQQINGIETL